MTAFNLKPRESVILAEDFQAMVDWYQRVLHFKIVQMHSEDYQYCNLENESGIQIGIAAASQMGVVPEDRRKNTVLLQVAVADVPGFFEYLSNENVQIGFGPSFERKGEYWYGELRDLEGNAIWVVDENCP